MSRFLYLNLYSFLIFFTGILTLIIPFFMINKWVFIIQAIIAIKLFTISTKLFFTWKDKERAIDTLKKRNLNEFRPDTFETFMQAPCGRLVVHQVLHDLNKQTEYKSLLKLQKPMLEQLRDNCTPVKTVIYINEEAI